MFTIRKLKVVKMAVFPQIDLQIESNIHQLQKVTIGSKILWQCQGPRAVKRTMEMKNKLKILILPQNTTKP